MTRWTELPPEDRWEDWDAWWRSTPTGLQETLLGLGWGEEPVIDARLRALPGAVEVDDRLGPPPDPFKTRIEVVRWRLTDAFRVWLEEKRAID